MSGRANGPVDSTSVYSFIILLTVVSGRGGHDEALLRGLTASDGRVVRRPIAVRQQETHAIHVTARAGVQQRALTARVQLVHLKKEKFRVFLCVRGKIVGRRGM